MSYLAIEIRVVHENDRDGPEDESYTCKKKLSHGKRVRDTRGISCGLSSQS